MVFIDESTVRDLFTVSDAMAAAERAFRALGTSRATMPQRLALQTPSGTHLSMPCHMKDDRGEVLTVKLATVFEGARDHGLPTTSANIAVHDPETGQLLALVEAEYLTAMRTAAASALATRYLANPNPKTLGVFGVGGQAQAHIRVFQETFPSIETVVTRSRTGAASVEKVSHCDVVILATSSSKPVLFGRDLRPGTQICAVGAFRPDMAEMDAQAVAMSRVFVDYKPAAMSGAGDLIQAASDKRWSWDQLGGDLSDLVLKRVAGRNREDEITCFKSVGLAVQDAAAAAAVYAKHQLLQ